MEKYKHENLKFRIKNVAHSKEIQKLLFKLGYMWSPHSKDFKFTKFKVLYTNEDFNLGFSSQNYFLKNSHKEVEIQYLKSKLGLNNTELNFNRY